MHPPPCLGMNLVTIRAANAVLGMGSGIPVPFMLALRMAVQTGGVGLFCRPQGETNNFHGISTICVETARAVAVFALLALTAHETCS